jgi:hypothetical protein
MQIIKKKSNSACELANLIMVINHLAKRTRGFEESAYIEGKNGNVSPYFSKDK